MDLKFRISLYFTTVLCALLTLFSILVYSQMQKKLVWASSQALTATVEHEWRHLQLRHGVVPDVGETLHTKNAYLRVWKDGILVRDSFPPAMRGLTEAALRSNRTTITQRFGRELDGAQYVLLGVYDLNSTDSYLATLRKVLGLGCLLAALLTLPGGWLLTKSLLSPFRTFTLKTVELDVERLSFRFDEPKQRDEYGILVRSFNALLTRLEKSFKQTRRFATNASHELRTPLTVIRGEAELLLRRERSTLDYQTGIKNILGQAKTLQGIVTRLLFLADLERREQEDTKTDINISHTVTEALRYLQTAHASSNCKIGVEGESLSFKGDQEIFGSIVSNLLENAIKYSRGQVRIRFEKNSDGLHCIVEDDGPGIPEGKRELVFEPFFKLPNQTAQGHGIGLSIVKACVNAIRGKISLASSPLGGLSVSVFFPDAA